MSIKQLIKKLFIPVIMFFLLESNVALANSDAGDFVFSVNATLNIMNEVSLHPGVNNVQYVFTPQDSTQAYTYVFYSGQYPGPNGYAMDSTGVKKLYIAWGYMGSDGPVFVPYDVNLQTPAMKGPVKFIGTFVTDDGKPPRAGEYDVVYSGLDSVGQKTEQNITVASHRLVLQGHVSIISATCATQTSNIIDIHWPSLSPSEIKNGSAASKKAEVTVKCDGSAEIPPMSVTFTSSEGSNDASGGIIKTTSDNLGLKLTWANDNTAIPLNQTISIPGPPPGSSRDLSVMAQPVSTGTGSISAGDFTSTLTMSIEYP